MTSPTLATSSPAISPAAASPWSQSPEWYQLKLAEVLDSYITRLTIATGLTLDEIGQKRLGLKRGNHLSQLRSGKPAYVLSPALAMELEVALELNKVETDELVILTMRANSKRSSNMTPEFVNRYEVAILRKVVYAARGKGIRLS